MVQQPDQGSNRKKKVNNNHVENSLFFFQITKLERTCEDDPWESLFVDMETPPEAAATREWSCFPSWVWDPTESDDDGGDRRGGGNEEWKEALMMVEEEYRETIVDEIPCFFRRKAFKTMKDAIFYGLDWTDRGSVWFVFFFFFLTDESRVVSNVYTTYLCV